MIKDPFRDNPKNLCSNCVVLDHTTCPKLEKLVPDIDKGVHECEWKDIIIRILDRLDFDALGRKKNYGPKAKQNTETDREAALMGSDRKTPYIF